MRTNYRRYERDQLTANRMRKRQRQHRKKIRRVCTTFLLIIITLITIGWLWLKFDESHFDRGTVINGVDCSWLTADDAYTKLNEQMKEKALTFKFDDNTYTFTGSSFDLAVSSPEELTELLENENDISEKGDLVLTSYSLDQNRLNVTLKTIPELDTAKMFHSENAYISSSEDGTLSIVPEINGTYINFDEACKLTSDKLLSGNTEVIFTSLVEEKPTITTDDLQETVENINSILGTTISFTITDDCVLTLDKERMKEWIVVDEAGNYSINIEDNLPAFVEELAKKSSQAIVYFDFEATDFGTVRVPAKNLSIDKEAEINRIKSELGSATSHEHTPFYTINIGGTYVEIDIARQHVWLYLNGVCIMDTDCVTGNKGNHDTREGYFFLTSKETDRILRGYNDNGTKYASHVDFWMPFDGGIGLHDAAWRHGIFGGDIYLTNGSHGCVNLPRSAAEKIYNTIDFSTPIIVYYSTK